MILWCFLFHLFFEFSASFVRIRTIRSRRESDAVDFCPTLSGRYRETPSTSHRTNLLISTVSIGPSVYRSRTSSRYVRSPLAPRTVQHSAQVQTKLKGDNLVGGGVGLTRLQLWTLVGFPSQQIRYQLTTSFKKKKKLRTCCEASLHSWIRLLGLFRSAHITRHV